MRILLAEDEADLRDVIVKRLSKEHYSVDACDNGTAALSYLTLAEYDAAILDIMMPGMNGISVVRDMRAQGILTPVLFLTAKDAVADRVLGLDSGADDYMVKPFAFDELLARLRVMTRHTASQPTNVFTLADLTVDCAARAVTRDGRSIDLTSREFSILEYMIRNKDIVLSRDRIEAHIWNDDYAGASNMVDVYIRCLRKKIDEWHDKKLIHTVRYVGYVLRAEP